MSNLNASGFCPICEAPATFASESDWLRDNFFCTTCGSIPRERAIMRVIQLLYPDWRNLVIHESSPGARGASTALRRGCSRYIPSQLWPGVAPGELRNGVRCENLEKLTFADNSIDLHITQDVLEHILNADAAFREIARTLKPGGAHICTVPLVLKRESSIQRARLGSDGLIEHLLEPVYHGNPIDASGSLVTTDWGYDICQRIENISGLTTSRIVIDDIGMGIRAEFIDVIVCRKPAK